MFALAAAYLNTKFWGATPKENLQSGLSSKREFIICLLIPALGAALFWLFRVETHFLGDGYHVLAKLPSSSPQIKTTELGQTWIHLLFFKLFSNADKETALLTYQILSVIAGFMFLFAVGIFSFHQYPDTLRRVLFFLGLSTSGCVLLFFGYVEHYSWLILTVFVVALTGVLSINAQFNKWLVTLVFLLAIFFHVIALAAAPAVLYLLLRGTRASRISSLWKYAATMILLVIGTSAFTYLYTTSYFFKFAFVPIVPIEITTEGYTLFSFSHLADFANLIFLLFPGFLILAWLLWQSRKWIWHFPPFRFLGLMTLSIAFCLFVIDPKLGMPRDWDLYCMVAVPLTILFYLLALNQKWTDNRGVISASVAIVLALAVLIPRVSSLNSPQLAISHLMNYMKLDRAKSRAASHLLLDYYAAVGDPVSAKIEEDRFLREYPEMAIAIQSARFIELNQHQASIDACEAAIRINPLFWNAYTNMGLSLIYLERNEAALQALQIADGINPNNSVILLNLGLAWTQRKNFVRAEDAWLRSYKNDTANLAALSFLVELYKITGEREKQIQTLSLLSPKVNAPVETKIAMAKYYLDIGFPDSAAMVYFRAISQGADSSAFAELLKNNPKFHNYLRQK
jgi:tetratricopeptide (TPR) repeat protein